MQVFNPVWSSLKSFLKKENRFSTEEFLLDIPLFDGLTIKEIKRIIPLIHHRSYQPEEHVFYKGQPGAAFYIIKSGRLQIVQPGTPRVVLAELGEGEILGELAILDETPRSASALAIEPTELMAFFKDDIDELITREPVISAKIYRNLAIIVGIRLKNTNELISNTQTS